MVRVMYSVGGDNNCGTRTLLSKDGKLGKGGKRQVSGAHMANSLQFVVWLSTLLASLCASAEEVDGPRQYIGLETYFEIAHQVWELRRCMTIGSTRLHNNQYEGARNTIANL